MDQVTDPGSSPRSCAYHGGAAGSSKKKMKAANDMASSAMVKRRNCVRSTSHSAIPTAMGKRKWQK